MRYAIHTNDFKPGVRKHLPKPIQQMLRDGPVIISSVDELQPPVQNKIIINKPPKRLSTEDCG